MRKTTWVLAGILILSIAALAYYKTVYRFVDCGLYTAVTDEKITSECYGFSFKIPTGMGIFNVPEDISKEPLIFMFHKHVPGATPFFITEAKEQRQFLPGLKESLKSLSSATEEEKEYIKTAFESFFKDKNADIKTAEYTDVYGKPALRLVMAEPDGMNSDFALFIHKGNIIVLAYYYEEEDKEQREETEALYKTLEFFKPF